jgi:hypothetical protein
MSVGEKMLKRKIKIITSILLSCAIAVVLFFIYGNLINQSYQGRLWSIEQVISDFIKENNGRFPANQQELIDRGYIKVEHTNGTSRYFTKVKFGSKEEWREWPVYLERFTIRYGADKEDYVVINDGLYEKKTMKRVFLIDGPHNRKMEPTLRRSYNLISLKWYNKMNEPATEQSAKTEQGK